jgi:mannose-6-phosphate isomerase-like protein (cupin superfamily)
MDQPQTSRRKPRLETVAAAGLAVVLGLGWACREAAFAREKVALLASSTINLGQLETKDFSDKGQKVGRNGVYLAGDTPGSTKFVTGRFIIDPGKTPHAPHTHVEEEVMIIESGTGEIFCDGKTTKVGPGSVMYTTPDAPHGINNTGDTPLVFYYVKWAGKDGSGK